MLRLSIQVQEKYLEVEVGRNAELGEDPSKNYCTKTQVDEVNEELWVH